MSVESRTPQPVGTRGSLKWIQRLVGSQSELLSEAIRPVVSTDPHWTVEWVSPREADNFAEYRDAAFLRCIRRPEFLSQLKHFWPIGGPRWDALGVGSLGEVILVEAKAHFGELSSSCAAGPKSLEMIRRALDAAKIPFGAAPESDWLTGYYQYANRLAHLAFLRSQGAEAYLVFLYFCGDRDMKGPESVDQWKEALKTVYHHLGVAGDLEALGVINVFIPVSQL